MVGRNGGGGRGGAACKATYHLGYAPVSHNVSCVYEAVEHLGGLLYQVALIGVVLQLIIYSRHTTTTTASLHHPHNPLLRCAALTPSDWLDGRLRSGGSLSSFVMRYVPAHWLPDKSSPNTSAMLRRTACGGAGTWFLVSFHNMIMAKNGESQAALQPEQTKASSNSPKAFHARTAVKRSANRFLSHGCD